MRRALVAVVVLVVVLIAADFALRWYAERWFAGEVRKNAELQQRPDLSLGGFPFAVALARGRFPSAALEASAVVAGGLRIDRLELDLEDVRFPPGAMFGSETGIVRVARGSGGATVTEEDLTAYVNFQGYPGRVRLSSGHATVETGGAAGEVTATGTLALEDGALVFRPEEVESGGATAPIPASVVAFSFQLERPLPGVSYRGVRVGEGTATLELSVRDARIEVRPEG